MSHLRPYHAFEIEGNHYVYSVWGMSYRRVSARTIEELAIAREDAAADLAPETLATIKELERQGAVRGGHPRQGPPCGSFGPREG